MGAREGRYRCTRGPIMGFESRAISARVTKQIDTIFSKTCDNEIYYMFLPMQNQGYIIIRDILSETRRHKQRRL